MKKTTLFSIIGIAVISLYSGIHFWVKSSTEKDIQAYIKKSADRFQITYDDLSLCLITGTATLENIQIVDLSDKKAYKIHELSVSNFDSKNEVPHSLDVSLSGFEIDFNNMDDNGKALLDMGYKSPILVNTSLAYEWDADSKIYDLQELSISADDMGKLSGKFTLGNIDLNQENKQMAMFTMTFIELELSYKDYGYFPKVIQAALKDSSGSVIAKAQEQIKTSLQTSTDPLSQQALKALSEFLSNPNSIRISAKPNEPVPLMAMLMAFSEPANLVPLLNIKID